VALTHIPANAERPEKSMPNPPPQPIQRERALTHRPRADEGHVHRPGHRRRGRLQQPSQCCDQTLDRGRSTSSSRPKECGTFVRGTPVFKSHSIVDSSQVPNELAGLGLRDDAWSVCLKRAAAVELRFNVSIDVSVELWLHT
jgi:hypothetical protein